MVRTEDKGVLSRSLLSGTLTSRLEHADPVEEAMPPRLPRRRLTRPRLLAFSSCSRSFTGFPSLFTNSRRFRHHRPPSSNSKSSRKRPAKALGRNSTGCNTKKRTRGAESPLSDEGDDQEEIFLATDGSPQDFVNADFVFFDTKPEDFHGAKLLLQTYLDVEKWGLSDFVDLILGQTTVGTVVKIEDDDDDDVLFSLITAINLERYKGHQCIGELREFLLKVCNENVRHHLKLLLGEQARHVGLLISQRVLNLPLELLPPLYDALFDEVSWATEDEPTQELRNSFRFRFYLIVTRFYKKISKSSEEDVIYIKPEDEIFRKLSSWSFTFSLRTKELFTHEGKKYRLVGLVMSVEADKIPTFRKELKSSVTES